MKDLLNCPNCGAPIQDDICPYCGSVFLDWAAFDIQKPTFVKVKDYQGRILLMQLSTPSVRITIERENTGYFYADNVRIPYTSSFPDATIEAEFKALPYHSKILGKDVLYMLIDQNKADGSEVKKILEEIK